MVWVTTTNYPDGYSDPEAGIYKSVKVICTYDAETGKVLSVDVLVKRIGGRNPISNIKNVH